MVAGSRRHRTSSAATFSNTMTGPLSSVAFSVAVDGRGAKDFELKHGEGKVIKVGRYPKSHVVLDHPGVSNQHLQLKLIPSYKGLAVRDVSSNGTGMQLAGSEEALRLEKDVDTPLPDGALILLPFHVKGGKNSGTSTTLRAGLRVRLLNVPPDVLLEKDSGTTVVASEELASTSHTRPVVEPQQHEGFDASMRGEGGSEAVDPAQHEVDQQQPLGQQQQDLERKHRRREKRARKDDRQKQDRGRWRSKLESNMREAAARDKRSGQCRAEDHSRVKRPRRSDQKIKRHSRRGESGRGDELERQLQEETPQQCEGVHRGMRGSHEEEAGPHRGDEVPAPWSYEHCRQDHEVHDRSEIGDEEGMLTTLPEGNAYQREEEQNVESSEMAFPNQEHTMQVQLEQQLQEQTPEDYQKYGWQLPLRRELCEQNDREELGYLDALDGRECQERQDMDCEQQEEKALGEEEPTDHQQEVHYIEAHHDAAPPKQADEDTFNRFEQATIDWQREEGRHQTEQEHVARHTHQDEVAADASNLETGIALVVDQPDVEPSNQELAPRTLSSGMTGIAVVSDQPDVEPSNQELAPRTLSSGLTGIAVVADQPDDEPSNQELAPRTRSSGLTGIANVADQPDVEPSNQELAPRTLSSGPFVDMPDVDRIKVAPEETSPVPGGARSTTDSSSKLAAASSIRRTGLDSGIMSVASGIRSVAPQTSLPPWVALGQRVHYWSASQKSHFLVKVTKLDEQKRTVIATFESDSKIWKSVPYSQFGRSSCPLRPLPSSAQSEGQSAQADRKGPIAKDKKRQRSRTPEWWQMENERALKEKAAERERQLQEQLKREQERIRDERRRKELMEAEQRKVQEAFEKRKQEAEERRLREEEEWREGLRRQREQEAAEEALEKEGLREQEREERKQRRREEREKKKIEEIQERERSLAEEKNRQPPPPPPPPAAVQATARIPPPQVLTGSGGNHMQSVAPPAQPPAWYGQLQQSSWYDMSTGAAPWAHAAGGPAAWGWPNAALVNPMYCQCPVDLMKMQRS